MANEVAIPGAARHDRTEARPLTDAAKRAFDLMAAGVGLCVLAPFLAGVAVAIRLDSPGAALYRARRVGRGGRPLLVYKFRTMCPGAERLGGSSTAETDRRITRVGRFLRLYKIDELPQLLNVVKGEMSLVGPRPEVEEYTRLYTEEEQAILTVRPGITDYASIQFVTLNRLLSQVEDPDRYYKEVIRPEKNRLRLEYVRRRSFLSDLGILAWTLKVVFLQGQGAGGPRA